MANIHMDTRLLSYKNTFDSHTHIHGIPTFVSINDDDIHLKDQNI